MKYKHRIKIQAPRYALTSIPKSEELIPSNPARFEYLLSLWLISYVLLCFTFFYLPIYSSILWVLARISAVLSLAEQHDYQRKSLSLALNLGTDHPLLLRFSVQTPSLFRRLVLRVVEFLPGFALRSSFPHLPQIFSYFSIKCHILKLPAMYIKNAFLS